MAKFDFHFFVALIRAIFPRWNFFDQIAYHFELAFKVSDSSPWESVSFNQPRRFLSLFLNPTCNLAMAQVNVLEHFAHDVQQLQASDAQSLSTFKMVRSLLAEKLRENDVPTRTVQFKIVAKRPGESLEIFVSDWLTLEPE